jgi:hypothetical protein
VSTELFPSNGCCTVSYLHGTVRQTARLNSSRLFYVQISSVPSVSRSCSGFTAIPFSSQFQYCYSEPWRRVGRVRTRSYSSLCFVFSVHSRNNRLYRIPRMSPDSGHPRRIGIQCYLHKYDTELQRTNSRTIKDKIAVQSRSYRMQQLRLSLIK